MYTVQQSIIQSPFFTIIVLTTTITTPTTPTNSCAYKGDGFCDDINNNADCEFDGGDCCLNPVQTYYCTECLCHNTSYIPSKSLNS